MNGTKFDGLKWSRKAESWDAVKGDDRALALSEGLDCYPAGEYPTESWHGNDRPQYFVARVRETGELFLINTEGYDYCRYAVRIKGLAIRPAAGRAKSNDDLDGNL